MVEIGARADTKQRQRPAALPLTKITVTITGRACGLTTCGIIKLRCTCKEAVGIKKKKENHTLLRYDTAETEFCNMLHSLHHLY